MSETIPRPFTVTLLVVLIWVVAIINIVFGIGQITGAFTEAGQEYGWAALIYGLIVALIAIRLSKGGSFLRMLLTIVLVFRLAIDVFILFSDFGGAVVSMAFNIFLLWLLWNNKANAFFNQS